MPIGRRTCCYRSSLDHARASVGFRRTATGAAPPQRTRDMNTIRFERREGVGSIVLGNPPFNRVDSKYASLLRQAVRAASESDIRVLLVRAEGPNFSLGGEVRE